MIVVNIKHDEFDVHIGRPSKWGNPFRLEDNSRTEAIEKYRNYIESTPELLNSLYELDNKRLGCTCKPQACHGDVLVELRQLQLNDEVL